MSPRDRIRHLYRRLGFGITPIDLDLAVKDGFDIHRKRLIDYAKIPLANDPSPFEFVWREKEEPDLGPWRYRTWWIYRMITTPRPLEEKLAIFWHDHFAVSDNKVENGPMMLEYLRTIQRHAGGKFEDLLIAVSKEPAMMRWLDMSRSIRGVPNENFAREVMELFTLGIGNYTEKDVQEASRAFTGWGYNELFWELPGNTEQKVNDAIDYGRPFAAFFDSPAMHDDRPKTILGKTANFNGDSFLRFLANHPQTARYMSEKLWTYFAYENPERTVIDALASVWKSSQGDILAVIDAMTKRPEFYSERAIRSKVKCPADLLISVSRAMGLGPALLAMRETNVKPKTRIPQVVIDITGEVSYNLDRLGMSLFYPPDVAGWEWGTAWTSAALMAERMKFRGVRLWKENGIGEGSQGVYNALTAKKPTTIEGLAQAFVELFDVPLPPERQKPIIEALQRGGGLNALNKPQDVAGLLWHGMPVLMAAPEMHLC